MSSSSVKSEPRLNVALVHDALPYIGGAERVLATAMDIFPAAPIYTLIHNPEALAGTPFEGREIHASFINRLPAAHTKYRNYLPLFPLAVEQLDLRAYDLILSFNYAVAHGVRLAPRQVHISYTYTPLRQAWQEYHSYLVGAGLNAGPKSWAARATLQYLRRWDYAAARRVGCLLAVSRWAAFNIWRAYRRPAEVLYPPVDVEAYRPLSPRDDYFISLARLEPRKRVDLIVKAFSRLGLPLLVVGDGPEYDRIAALAGPNVQMLGRIPDSEVSELLGRARAFVMAAEEDFGMAAVEAQAAGCPVIAYGRGGALETVREGRTGLFFAEQSVDSLIAAVLRFTQGSLKFNPSDLRANVQRFDKTLFQNKLAQLVEREWSRADHKAYEEYANPISFTPI
ncbi:MAG TPA: glycosyltransferase [Anaerolineales bacterium]